MQKFKFKGFAISEKGMNEWVRQWMLAFMDDFTTKKKQKMININTDARNVASFIWIFWPRKVIAKNNTMSRALEKPLIITKSDYNTEKEEGVWWGPEACRRACRRC